jgi:hypothetical protein
VPETATAPVKARASANKERAAKEQPEGPQTSGDYTLPIVHVRVPAKAVNAGFWGGLVGAVALGAVDPPLGVLVGAGVLIARHQSGK